MNWKNIKISKNVEIVATALALAIIFSPSTISSGAATDNINLSLESQTGDHSWVLNDNTYTIYSGQIVEIQGKTSNKSVKVDKNAKDVTIVLNGASITSSIEGISPIDINGAEVTIKLLGTNYITASKAPAIKLEENGDLTIEADEDLNAELIAKTIGEDNKSACIGACGDEAHNNAGSLTINSGKIVARATGYGAGIGGGKAGNAGAVIINNGVVISEGGPNGGAGIGGGGGCIVSDNGNIRGGAGRVSIQGGIVESTGGYNEENMQTAIGIGSGVDYSNVESNVKTTGRLIINGGSIKTTGTENQPINSSEANLSKIEIPTEEYKMILVNGEDWNIDKAHSNDNKIHLYLPHENEGKEKYEVKIVNKNDEVITRIVRFTGYEDQYKIN